jgi:hypothetical protein
LVFALSPMGEGRGEGLRRTLFIISGRLRPLPLATTPDPEQAQPAGTEGSLRTYALTLTLSQRERESKPQTYSHGQHAGGTPHILSD